MLVLPAVLAATHDRARTAAGVRRLAEDHAALFVDLNGADDVVVFPTLISDVGLVEGAQA